MINVKYIKAFDGWGELGAIGINVILINDQLIALDLMKLKSLNTRTRQLLALASRLMAMFYLREATSIPAVSLSWQL